MSGRAHAHGWRALRAVQACFLPTALTPRSPRHNQQRARKPACPCSSFAACKRVLTPSLVSLQPPDRGGAAQPTAHAWPTPVDAPSCCREASHCAQVCAHIAVVTIKGSQGGGTLAGQAPLERIVQYRRSSWQQLPPWSATAARRRSTLVSWASISYHAAVLTEARARCCGCRSVVMTPPLPVKISASRPTVNSDTLPATYSPPAR